MGNCMVYIPILQFAIREYQKTLSVPRLKVVCFWFLDSQKNTRMQPHHKWRGFFLGFIKGGL